MRRSGFGRLSALLLGVLFTGILVQGRPVAAAEHVKTVGARPPEFFRIVRAGDLQRVQLIGVQGALISAA